MEYVVIDDLVFPLGTKGEIAEAKAALGEAGLPRCEVWSTPLMLDEMLTGNPDARKTGQFLYA